MAVGKKLPGNLTDNDGPKVKKKNKYVLNMYFYLNLRVFPELDIQMFSLADLACIFLYISSSISLSLRNNADNWEIFMTTIRESRNSSALILLIYLQKNNFDNKEKYK